MQEDFPGSVPPANDGDIGAPLPAIRIPFPPEEFPEAVVHRARRNVDVVLEDETTETMFLMRDVSPVGGAAPNESPRTMAAGPQQDQEQHDFPMAYWLFPKRKEALHRGLKGYIYYALVYEPHHDGVFVYYRPTSRVVVIKKLRKSWVRANQHCENPRHEIAAMQQHGDMQHVLGIVEAMEDDRNLYIITPFVGQDLLKCLVTASAPPNTVQLLRTLVRNLQYLRQQNLIHRDLSPENIIIHADLHEACCPLIDLAMSIRVTTLEGTPQLVNAGHQPCGKPPYMAPEVCCAQVLDFNADVWSLGCVMFFVWTRQRLYDCYGDDSYRFFLCQGGLRNGHLMEATLEALLATHLDTLPLTRRIQAVLQELNENQRDLLAQMLQPDTQRRITLEGILEHPWVRQEEERQLLAQQQQQQQNVAEY